jgi:hypothetical protein
MTKKSTPSDKAVPFSQISQLIGASSPVLPGVSKNLYQNGLQATITELDAATPLQIYLAEKSLTVCCGFVDTSHTKGRLSCERWEIC